MGPNIIIKVSVGLLLIFIFNSCTKNGPESEFIADENTFTNYKTWTLEKTYNGPDPLLHALAHLDNDNTVVRNAYFKDGQNAVDGNYPTGTVVVKESFNPSGSVSEFVAMAKRGSGFNPIGNNWEYFLLNSDGSIADLNGVPARGANLMSGICFGCHSTVSTRDFIFSK